MRRKKTKQHVYSDYHPSQNREGTLTIVHHLIGRTDSPNTPQLADILPKHCWFHFFSLTYPQRFLEQKCDLCAHVTPAKPWVSDLLLSSYNS